MKTRIRFGRIIVYIILYLTAVGFYRFLQSHYTLIILVTMSVAPVLSILSCLILRRYVSISLRTASDISRRNEISYLTVEVINPTFIPSMDVTIHINCENTFYKNKAGTGVSLPARVHRTSDVMLPMKLSMNGTIRYEADYIRVRDLMGFIDMGRKVDVSAELSVIPESTPESMISMSEMNQGMTESEETKKKGHDFSDVSDVREYIPGDRLMSIHWKLSAKRDILMVKDRESMSDEQMVVLISLSGTHQDVDNILCLGYNLVEGLVRENIYVKLLWWNETLFEFEERQIGCLEDLREAFAGMYYSPIYKESGRIRDYMASIKPFLRSYVEVMTNESGEPDAVIVEQ